MDLVFCPGDIATQLEVLPASVNLVNGGVLQSITVLMIYTSAACVMVIIASDGIIFMIHIDFLSAASKTNPRR